MISTYLYLSDYLKTPLSTWAQLLLTHQVGSSIIITHSRTNYLLIFLTDFKSTPTPPGQTFIASKFSLSSPYVARHFVIRGTLELIINIWWSNWWWITHVTSVLCFISPAAIYDRQHHIARNRHNGRCRNRTTAAGARLPGRRGPHQGWHAQLYPVGQPPPDNRLCPRLLDSHFRVSWTSSQLIVQWFGDKTFQNSRHSWISIFTVDLK